MKSNPAFSFLSRRFEDIFSGQARPKLIPSASPVAAVRRELLNAKNFARKNQALIEKFVDALAARIYPQRQ
jgi:hypothetical protein